MVSWLTTPLKRVCGLPGALMREVPMTKKSRTSLDRDKVQLWTAIFGFLKAVTELAIKAVSYARGNSKFRLQLLA